MDARLRRIAEQTPGFMPPDEGYALYTAARQAARLDTVLEIGSYCGKSTLYLAAAAAEVGGRVVTIDHHRGSEEHQPGEEYHDPQLIDRRTGRVDTLPQLRQTLCAAGVEENVVVVVGGSAAVWSVWGSPIAMLFIDGGHSEEAAWNDYRLWSRHVVRGGVLAIHDVFPDPADGGRAPYLIYRAALAGDFTEASATGSLRVLMRTTGGAVADQCAAGAARR